MGVMKRISTIFQAKSNAALDKVEDPRQMLDLSYEQQLDNLTKVKRAVADVASREGSSDGNVDVAAIRSALQKRWDVDYISQLTPQEVKVIRVGSGLFLAYETRSMKARCINDSRYVGMSIYNVVVLCLITAPVSLVISSQADASFAFVTAALVFCCFLSMALIFLPKVLFIISF